MARFCGEVGFAVTEETSPGVWTERITERTYYGDMIRAANRPNNSDTIVSNININNSITIVADAFATEHFDQIRYVRIYGKPWRVTYVEIKHPRLSVEFGGLYNGPTA